MSNVSRIMTAFFILLLLTFFGCESVQKDFDKAAKANTEQSYRDFIKTHGGHPFAKEAKKRLELIVYEAAIKSNDEKALENFLAEFPDGAKFNEAKQRLESIAFEAALKLNNEKAWEGFLAKFPDGSKFIEAKQQLEQLVLKAARQTGTLEAYENFIQRFPDSPQLKQAKAELRKMVWPKVPSSAFSHGMWQIVTVDAPLKNGILGIEDFKVEKRGAHGEDITITVKTFAIDDYHDGMGRPVWGDITVQPEDGKAMDLTPAFEMGNRLGYKFNVNQVSALTVGNKIAIYDSKGWHVVTVATSLKHNILGIRNYEVTTTNAAGNETTVIVKELRLIDSEGGKTGLVWNMRTKH